MGIKFFHSSFGKILFLILILVLSYSFYPNELQESADFVSPQNQAQKALRHDAAAVVKLVQVRVIDQNGHVVSGLKKEDFVLHDNKALKKITEFEVHNLEDPGKAPEKTEIALGTTPIKEMIHKYFFFFDDSGKNPIGETNADKAAFHFVDAKLKLEDEAAVFYFGPMTGFRVLEQLTSDKDKIKKAIKQTTELPPTPGFSSGNEIALDQKRAEQEKALQDRRNATEVKSDGIVGAAENTIAENTIYETLRSFDSSALVAAPGLGMYSREEGFRDCMSELAKAIQYVPGNKSFVLFSSRNIDKGLGREFATANIPVFAINTKNWIVKRVEDVAIKEKYIYTEHPLKDFALESGGQYFADIKNVETNAENIQMLSGNYYVLGYYVDEKWDGKFHEIKVEVSRPGCTVLVQNGFSNPKPFAQKSEVERKLQIYDLAYSDTLAVENTLEAPLDSLVGSDGKGANVVILSRLQVDAKTGIPPGKTEIYSFIFDKDRKTVFHVRSEIDLTPFAKKTLYPYFSASLKSGDYECRFVAHDPTTGRAVVGRSFFKTFEPMDSSMSFSAVLLFIQGKDPQFLKALRQKKGRFTASSLIDFYPLIPKRCSPLVRNLETDDKKLLAVIPAEFQSGEMPKLDWDFRLTAIPPGEGFPVRGKILDTKKLGIGKCVYVLEIDLPDLQPGNYDLEIIAKEATIRREYVITKSLTKK